MPLHKDATIETHLIEYVLQPLLRKRRTLDILDSTQLSRKSLSLLTRDRSLFLPLQLLQHSCVVPQINLSTNN